MDGAFVKWWPPALSSDRSEKKSLVRITLSTIMFQCRSGTNANLLPLEMRILKFIKPKSQTEKKIAKSLEVDSIVLSPIITDLILKGYLEIFRRRKMYFFTKEMCTITPEGISALDKSRTPLQGLIEMIRSKAVEALQSIVSESPSLNVVAMSARTIYKVAKAIG